MACILSSRGADAGVAAGHQSCNRYGARGQTCAGTGDAGQVAGAVGQLKAFFSNFETLLIAALRGGAL